MVKLVKDIVPVDAQLGDPGKFDLSIDGEGGSTAPRMRPAAATQSRVTVPNGTRRPTESADGETSLNDYASQLPLRRPKATTRSTATARR